MCDNMHSWLAYASRCIKPQKQHLCHLMQYPSWMNIPLITKHANPSWYLGFCSENSMESILFWHLFINFFFGQYGIAMRCSLFKVIWRNDAILWFIWKSMCMRDIDDVFAYFPSWWYCICTRSMDWCLMCTAKVYSISIGTHTASFSCANEFFFCLWWSFFFLCGCCFCLMFHAKQVSASSDQCFFSSHSYFKRMTETSAACGKTFAFFFVSVVGCRCCYWW